jgi:YHS domain-containing protein
VTRVILFAALLLTLAWAFWRLVDGVIETFGVTTNRTPRKRRAAAVKLARDPVCGTWVSPSDAQFVQAGSTTHYFCSEECRRKFQSR